MDNQETVDVVGSVADLNIVKSAARNCNAVIHCAALHAPHASHHHSDEFTSVNVNGTRNILSLNLPTVFTSTTSHTITNDIKNRESN